MAIEYLQLNSASSKISGSAIYDYTKRLTAGQRGASVMLPDGAGKVGSFIVALKITSGQGRVEYTTSQRETVKAGSGSWRYWDAGNVSANSDDILEPPTAVRAVCVSGAITFEVIAQ